MNEVFYRDLGAIDYGECWNLQKELFNGILENKRNAVGAAGQAVSGNPKGRQYLLLCEHPPVYTLGKSAEEGNMLVSDEYLRMHGAAVFRIDRGGDVTFHGPGQLVAYPILDLEKEKIGLREYIHSLEQAVIDTVAHYGIRGERVPGAAGVWLTEGGPLRKICAIGVRSSRFVTMHGLALNVSTDLGWFGHINPCGFTDRGVTSIEKENGEAPRMDEVKKLFTEHFGKIINVKIT